MLLSALLFPSLLGPFGVHFEKVSLRFSVTCCLRVEKEEEKHFITLAQQVYLMMLQLVQ